MAYKQKSVPFKQEKGYTPRLGKAIEENTKKNKWLNEVESSAKKDSTAASIDRLKSGGTKFQAGLQGNLAANKTRQLNNAWDLTVDRGRTSELYGSTAGGPNTATYTRRKPTVEQDVKMERNNIGELDVAKPKKKPAVRQMKSKTKTPPLKQMETIKKIGNKIYEGGKYLSDLAEGKKGSKDYSGGDETMRLKNIAKNKPKTSEVKKEVKKTPAKMKKC